MEHQVGYFIAEVLAIKWEQMVKNFEADGQPSD